MTGIRSDCAGRGVRQADALTGSDTGARSACSKAALFLFYSIFGLYVAVERLISCSFFTEKSFYSVQPVYSPSALQYLCLLLCVFLLEIIAGVLAYITYQEVNKCCVKLGCHVTNILTSFQQQCFPILPTEAHIFFHDVPFFFFGSASI